MVHSNLQDCHRKAGIRVWHGINGRAHPVQARRVVLRGGRVNEFVLGG